MLTVFSCLYGSRINGTANEQSDWDSRIVFYDESHPPRLDRVHSARVEGQSPSHVPLCNFLRACATGSFREIDWLFLPATAYEVPLPAELLDQRRQFLTLDAHRAYCAIARFNAEQVKTAWNPKMAYHGEIFRLSAVAIAGGDVPNFGHPDHVEHLRAIRYEWAQEQFAEHWARTWPETALQGSLPPHCDWGAVHRLYWMLIGRQDLIAAADLREKERQQAKASRAATASAPRMQAQRVREKKTTVAPGPSARQIERDRRLSICKGCGDFLGVRSANSVKCDRVPLECHCKNLDLEMCGNWEI